MGQLKPWSTRILRLNKMTEVDKAIQAKTINPPEINSFFVNDVGEPLLLFPPLLTSSSPLLLCPLISLGGLVIAPVRVTLRLFTWAVQRVSARKSLRIYCEPNCEPNVVPPVFGLRGKYLASAGLGCSLQIDTSIATSKHGKRSCAQ